MYRIRFVIIARMKKDIPLTIESISDSDELECRISSGRQIESILRNIAETGSNAALYYNPHRDFIMTTILDVDEDGMWVEQGSSGTVNLQITSSHRIKLISSHLQVKVQFSVNEASDVTYDGRPAFFLPLPESLYRFQRRGYFRLSFPTSQNMRCIVNMANPANAGAIEPREVTIVDISGGGLGLICLEGDVELQAGETYSRCELNLPGEGLLVVNLTVRNVVPLSTTKTGNVISRAGCEFRNIDGQTSAKLQRFITDKQRQMAAETTL